MNRDEIMSAVFKAIKRHVPDDERDEVTEETRLVDDLAFDSLDMVETVMDMERELGVAIPDDEADRLFVKGDIKAIIDGLEILLT